MKGIQARVIYWVKKTSGQLLTSYQDTSSLFSVPIFSGFDWYRAHVYLMQIRFQQSALLPNMQNILVVLNYQNTVNEMETRKANTKIECDDNRGKIRHWHHWFLSSSCGVGRYMFVDALKVISCRGLPSFSFAEWLKKGAQKKFLQPHYGITFHLYYEGILYIRNQISECMSYKQMHLQPLITAL